MTNGLSTRTESLCNSKWKDYDDETIFLHTGPVSVGGVCQRSGQLRLPRPHGTRHHGIEANISVLTHARLQLTPGLGGNDFPDDRYSFEWRTLARSADETVTVIGTSRNLDYEVALPAGAYTLFFKVTENASGVYWQQSCELQVSEATSEGWMVLCADGADDRRASTWSPR